MKICFISGALPDVSCGIGDYTDSLARALSRRGHEVVVVTTASPDLRSHTDYRVVPLQTDWSLGDAGKVAAAVRREHPDVMHLQFPGTGYGRGYGACFAPWAARLRGSRPLLATTLHEFQALRTRYRVRLALAVAACDLVISPDQTSLASMRRLLRLRPRLRTELIPLAASIWPSTEPSGAAQAHSGSDLVIGYWGLVRPDKGVDLLLEAFALVRRTRPARLVLAGDPGPETGYVDSLRRRADEMGIAASITTTGKLPADQLSATLQSFDVCCLPFRDGLTQNRTTYVGAVAHGLYVVTTAAGPRTFNPETNTAFVPPNDRDALVTAILDAPDHPRAHVSATAETAWDEIANRHLAAYRGGRG
jgi:glycosyltransferase involved in cell wall biosynthesis